MANDAAHVPTTPELESARGAPAAVLEAPPDDVDLAGVAGRTTPDASSEAPAPVSPRGAQQGVPEWSFASMEPDRDAGVADQPLLPLTASPPRPTCHQEPLLGPVGRSRAPLAVAFLSAVTLGVYALVWHRRINREMEEFDPQLHARPGRSALAVSLPWAIGLAASLAGATLIVAQRLTLHLPVDGRVSDLQAHLLLFGLVAIPYLILAIPFSAVAVVMTLERLRCVEEHVGLTADRQVRAVSTSLMLLFPVVGGLVLLALQQRRLNAVWGRAIPHGRPDR